MVEVDIYSTDDKGDGTTAKGVQRMLDNVLDKLCRLGQLPRRSYVAGCKYRGDAFLAGVAATPTSIDYTSNVVRPGHGRLPRSMESMDYSVVEARRRRSQIEKSLNERAVRLLDCALVSEQGFEQFGRDVLGWGSARDAAVAGKAVLVATLALLADVYDLLRRDGHL